MPSAALKKQSIFSSLNLINWKARASDLERLQFLLGETEETEVEDQSKARIQSSNFFILFLADGPLVMVILFSLIHQILLNKDNLCAILRSKY